MKTMNRSVLGLIAIGLILPLIWLACGSGGGDAGSIASGGIGGSGYQDTSAGSVTATGSITVNGVKFETDDATVTKNGEAFDRNNLAVGMVVEVQGSINADKVSGDAAQVYIQTVVVGAIESLAAGQLIVAGQTVFVDDRTVIVDETGSTLTPSDLSPADAVEISGLVAEDGTILATRIEVLSALDKVKVTGFIADLQATTFYINSLAVDYQHAVLIGFAAAGPAPDDYVEVVGTLNVGSLVAETVLHKTGPRDKQGLIELEGYIKNAAEPDFEMISTVGLLAFRINAQTTYKSGTVEDLAEGVRLEIEGYFENNRLIAETITFDSSLRLQAAVATADALTGAVNLVNLSGLTVFTDQQTRFKDRRKKSSGKSAKKPGFPDVLETLTNMELLTIKGRVSGGDRLVATEVKIENGPDTSGDVLLRGPVTGTSTDFTTFGLLNILISTDYATDFEGKKGTALDRNAFFQQLPVGQPVQVKGVTTADNAVAARIASLED